MINYNLDIDLSSYLDKVLCTLQQGEDGGREIQFHVMQNGADYTPLAATTDQLICKLQIDKPDGTTIITSTTDKITDHNHIRIKSTTPLILSYTVGKNTCAVEGVLHCKLSILQGNTPSSTTTLKSVLFKMRVEAGVKREEDVVSSSEYQRFEDFIDKIDTFEEKVTKYENHISNHSNPHQVTASQVGTYTSQEINNKIQEVVNSPRFADGRIYSQSSVNLNRKADTAVGSCSFSFGRNNEASGECSHAEGEESVASNDWAHAEGSSSKATARSSHAEGNNTTASGYASHAEGVETVASGIDSHSEGSYTIASKQDSHAEGQNTKAEGSASHAEGSGTTASGTSSHAEGSGSSATGDYAHAEGSETTAAGYASHAEGKGTLSSETCSYQHVQGKYNVEDTEGTYADIIGGGTSNNTRKNISALDWEGNLYLSGDIYVNDDKENSLSQLAGHTITYNLSKSGSTIKLTGSDGSESTVTDNNTTYTPATSSTNGLMTPAMVTKLNNISAEANNYTLPASTASTLGGIKTGYINNGKNYKVQLDGSHNAFVNVPWENENTGVNSSIYGKEYLSMGRKPNTTVGLMSVTLGTSNESSGRCSISLGCGNKSTNESSIAGGYQNTSSALASIALGLDNIATDQAAIAIGQGNTTSHANGVAIGYGNTDSGGGFVAGFRSNSKSSGACIGSYCSSNGSGGIAIGYYAVAGTSSNVGRAPSAVGYYVTSEGYGAIATGKYNKALNECSSGSSTYGDALVVGNGTSDTARSNAFRVTYSGEVYGTSSFKSSGADYAEFIKPWHDNNEQNEDRVGYFVTVKNGLLYKASEGNIIAGITSGCPSVVGNADEDYYWRWERDEFNRVIMEDIPETIEKTDENGNVIYDEKTNQPIKIETGNILKNAKMKQSANYDPSRQNTYVERKDRREWDYVGMIGVLPVRDDGTCIAGHLCKCGTDGIATYASKRDFDTYMVIERINDHIISVILK